MSLENISLDVTITMVDNNKQEKAGQLRYIVKGSEAEIFDTFVFPEYRRKKMMSSLVKKMIPELKVSGISKVKLKYLNEEARAAWESVGFRKSDKDGHLELNISELNIS